MPTFGEKILELSTIDSPNTVRDHLLSAVQEVNAVITAEASVDSLPVEVGVSIASTSIEVSVSVSCP
jgi:hypothetical protein